MNPRLRATPTPAGFDPGLGPETSSARGWPTVVYFHHVNPTWRHYTSLTPPLLALALDLLLDRFAVVAPTTLRAGVRPDVDKPAVVITFDDCYLDTYEWGLPLLEERGIKATFFAITDAVARSSSVRRARSHGAHMDWSQLADLRDLGHAVGSHTAGHRRLADLPATEVEREVRRGDRALLEHLGTPPSLLAYPYGSVPADAARMSVFRDRLCFGTVRSPARAWDAAPHEIRRTYLPFDSPQTWEALVDGWVSSW